MTDQPASSPRDEGDDLVVEVDRERCQGHAMCWGAAPELFSVDELGYSNIGRIRIGKEMSEQARAGERNCPEGAIRVSRAERQE